MTATMTRHEQQIAARYGCPMVCLVASCFVDLAHIKSSCRGQSDFRINDEKFWMDTTDRGIELRATLGQPAVHVLPWSHITRHIAALPAALRARARRVDRLAHTTFPYDQWNPGRTTADIVAEGTAKRAWATERYHRVNTLRGAILQAAFPLAYDTEPVDLFDLLELAAASP